MVNKELSTYVRSAMDAGQTLEEIRAALLGVGWQEADIAEALSMAKPSPQAPAPAPSPVSAQSEPAANPWVASAHPATANSPEHTANIINSMYTQSPANNATSQQQAPQTTDPSLNQDLAPVTSQAKTTSKPGIIVAIVVGIVLLGGGSVFAALALWPADPNKILAESIATELAATSGKVSLTQSVEVTGDLANKIPGVSSGQPAKATLTVDGNYEEVASSTNTDISVHGTFGEFSAGLEERNVGKMAYVKVAELPQILLVFVPQANDYVNKWISINPDNILGTVQNTSGINITASSSVAMDFADKDKMAALNKKLSSTVNAYMPLSVSKSLPDEKVGSENAYHYQLAIDKVKLKALYTQSIQDFRDTYKDTSTATAQDVADSQAEFEKFLASPAFDSLSIEVWITKSGHNLARIKISDSFDPETLSNTPSAFPTSENPSKVTFTFDATLTEHNKPQNISAPTDATPIEDVLGQVFGSFKPSANTVTSSTDSLLSSAQSTCGDLSAKIASCISTSCTVSGPEVTPVNFSISKGQNDKCNLVAIGETTKLSCMLSAGEQSTFAQFFGNFNKFIRGEIPKEAYLTAPYILNGSQTANLMESAISSGICSME